MDISYCFSSPDGDITLGPDDLRRPFLLASGVAHERLLLGHYFQAIEKFVFRNSMTAVAALLSGLAQTEVKIADLQRAVFRSEKHGKLYHIASVELFGAQGSQKFAISAALSQEGMACLKKDFNLILKLSGSFHGTTFIPAQYVVDEMELEEGAPIPVVMTLSEWCDNFHEWHLSYDPENDTHGICLWDYAAGNTFLDHQEGLRIFEKASEILTHYFDPASGCQIYPWHHAAGDFIVRREQGEIDVRLVTVRDYKALVELPPEQQASPLAQWISFFLHLTIRMRLDKIDGVAETVWLDDSVVGAVLKGFFRAYDQKVSSHGGLPVPDFLRILQSFGQEELSGMSHALCAIYAAESASDSRVIQEKSDAHWRTVSGELQFYQD